jgi:hypothetical protein
LSASQTGRGSNHPGRAIPDETGHYWEVADDTIGRPPLFLIVFSFFPLGKLPLAIRNLMNKIQPGLRTESLKGGGEK